MAYIKELLKRSFDIWCMKNWQKTIDKEIDLCHKYERKSARYMYKARHCRKVAQKVFDEYCKLYPGAKEQAGEPI